MPRKKKETLKRRRDGRYRCKYQNLQFYGDTPEEAFAARDQYIADQAKGFSSRITVEDYALPWLKRTYPNVADSTYTGLAIHLQHLVDAIGDHQIDTVVPSDIKAIYSTQYLDYSYSYIKAAKHLYCALFDSAVADGLIRRNPARDRTAKPHAGKGVKTRCITPQEREWINTYCHDHRAYPAVITMLYAGLRPQEAKALDIGTAYDEKNAVLHITETAHKSGDNKYEITKKGKTKNAVRDVPVFPPVAEALKGRSGRLIATAKGEQITRSAWNETFRSYKNCMETAINGCRKRWYGKTIEHRKLLAEGKPLPTWVEFSPIPYDYRHSFCVMCRDAEVEINTCRKWMGHVDSQMILKVYDSVSEDRSNAERKKVESKLFRVQNGVQAENEEDKTPDK
jgi:integrase